MTYPASSGGNDAVERLFKHKEKILHALEAVRVRRRQRRNLRAAGVLAALMILGIYTATAITWRTVDLAKINMVAIPIALACVALYLYLRHAEDGRGRDKKRLVSEYELELELAEDRRRLEAFSLQIPVQNRQYSYRDGLPRELEKLRLESQHYRRIHNLFQAVIIAGSIGTSTVAGMADTPSDLKWVTVGLSLAVGLSAGFTGYFKFRERGFYLQQTADAIEAQETAFELGIKPYTGTQEANLAKLAEEVETLRVEQRKRQQQLDQPHEGKDGTV